MKRIRMRDIFLLAILTLTLAACGGSDRDERGAGAGLLSSANSRFNTYELGEIDPAATFSAGVSINRHNAVVGMSDGASGTVKAAAWTVTPSGSTSAGASGTLPLPPGGGWSAAYGINDVGAIVGETETAPGGATVAAFWPSRTSVPQALQTLDASAGSAAYAINAVGRIVGESLHSSPRGFDSVAVTWATRSSSPAVLPVPAGTISSSAFSINRNGHIVGEIAETTGTRGIVWRPVGGRYTSFLLLPAPPGNSTALTINDLGVVSGEAAGSDGRPHAVRWIPGTGTLFTLVDLGAAGTSSSAAGINRSGLTFGNTVGTDELPIATAWDGTTAESSPVAPGFSFSQAYSANDGGWAVGMGDGKAFVAVPK